MARRPLRSALSRFAQALDVSPGPSAEAPAPVVEPARDAVPDDASALFEGRGGGRGGFGTSVLVNAITRAGTQQDASYFARWLTQRFLGRQEQFALGRNALSFQALSKIGDTACREWHTVEITDATEEDKIEIAQKVLDYETRLGLQTVIPNALRRGRQYGDAIVLLGIIDGRDPDQPVDVDGLATIKWAVVVDRRNFDYAEVAGPDSKDFGKPLLYRITDIDGVLQEGIRYFGQGTTTFSPEQFTEFYQTNGGDLLVHADRVMRFPTVDALSMLDTIQDSLEGYLSSIDGTKKAARDSGTVVYKISDWLQKSWHGNGGQVATDHLRKVHAGKAAANAYIIDQKHEDVSTLPNNLAGLGDAVKSMMVWLSAALNIPNTEFWQVSPGGFGTGDSEATRWHTTARAFQTQVVYPELRKCHGYILVALDGEIGLPFKARRKIIPGDLSPPDEETRSKLRSEAIDDMVKLSEANLVSRAEIRASLPSDDLFSLQLEEEIETDELTEATVAVWTGTIALAEAMFPNGVPPEFAAYLASKLGPQRYTSEEFLAQAQAAKGATPGPEGGAGLLGGTPPLDPVSGLPVVADPEGEEDGDDEHTTAWEAGQEPSDTKTSTELAEVFRVSPQRITSFAKRNGIRDWDAFGGRPRFSLRDFQAAHMERNDTAPPQSTTLMISIPDDVAAQFPEDPERGESHITMLSIGKTKPSERDKILDIVTRTVTDSSVNGGTATLGKLGYFDQPDEDHRVAFSEVDFTPKLDALQRSVRNDLEAEGVEVKHVEGAWTPHATLAYLPGMESEYTGEVPAGEFPVSVELWWGDKRFPIPLTSEIEA